MLNFHWLLCVKHVTNIITVCFWANTLYFISLSVNRSSEKSKYLHAFTQWITSLVFEQMLFLLARGTSCYNRQPFNILITILRIKKLLKRNQIKACVYFWLSLPMSHCLAYLSIVLVDPEKKNVLLAIKYRLKYNRQIRVKW